MTTTTMPPQPLLPERLYEKAILPEATENTRRRLGKTHEADEVNKVGDDPSGTPRGLSLANGTEDESFQVWDDLPVREEHKKLWLTNGGYALVDADLYEELASYTWRKYDNGYGNIYVSRYDAVSGKRLYLHRQITGAREGKCVDHKNSDTLDNRRGNLRLTDHRGNSRNRTKSKRYANRNTSSRFKGVTWDKSRARWKAHIGVDGRHKNLGRFENDIEAARAYDAAAIEHFGEFAHTNFGYNEPLLSEGVA